MTAGDWIGALGLTATVFGIVWTVYFNVLSETDTENYRQLKSRLVEGEGAIYAYRHRLLLLLNWVDRFFEQSNNKTPYKMNEWSAKAFERCLMLCVMYPLIAVLIGWTLFGNAGAFGQALGFENNSNTLFRYVYMSGFIFCVFLCYCGYKTNKKNMPLFYFASASLLSNLILRIPEWFDTVKPDGAGILLVAFAFSIFALRFLPSNKDRKISGTVIFGFSTAYTLFGTANGVYIAYRLPEIEFVLEGLIFLALSMAFSYALVFGIARLRLYADLPRSHPFILWLIMLGVILGISYYVYAITESGLLSGIEPRYFQFILAFTLIPIVNLPFDWLSTGLTRYCLRRGLTAKNNGSRTIWVCIDVTSAVLFMIGLCVVLIFFFEGYNALAHIGGVQITPIPVATQIELIASDPFSSTHFWLYFALFSTLLPTISHYTVYSVSLFSIPFGTSGYIARAIETDTLSKGAGARAKAAALLTVQWIAAVITVMVSVWGLLWMMSQTTYVGAVFLWIMETAQGMAHELFRTSLGV